MTQNLNLIGNTIQADAIVTTASNTNVSPLNIGAVGVYVGAGAPSSLTAPQGSIYLNTTASTSTTRLYVNTTGSTTWATFTASA